MRIKTASTFTFTILKNIVSIIDLDEGMSVTNDIENVVSAICKTKGINADEYKWIYKDSDGLWDGYNPITGTFIYLGTHLESDAKEMILYKH